MEVIYLPDPCELTYGNTILLSNAAVSLNFVYLSKDSLGIQDWSLAFSIYFIVLFITLQLKEFKYLGFYQNDSLTGCSFIFTTGLHFSHVVVGLIIVGITTNSMASGIVSNFLYSHVSLSMNLYLSVQVLYWHFVEVVWLVIFLNLYNY